MDPTKAERYLGWTITVHNEQNMCANFSFDITSPDGYTQHVAMGGLDENRALERAREMVDLEIELAGN